MPNFQGRCRGSLKADDPVTFCTFFTLLCPNLLGVADRGNGNIFKLSVHAFKFSDRSTSSQRAVANAMVNTP